MPFTGSWVLDYASKCSVSKWLKTLNISSNTVIDNQGFTMQIEHINGKCFLEGGLIYIENDRLYRIGKTKFRFMTHHIWFIPKRN